MYMYIIYINVVLVIAHNMYLLVYKNLADVVFHECSSHVDLMVTPGILSGQFEHIPRCFYTFSPATKLHVLNVHLCKSMD